MAMTATLWLLSLVLAFAVTVESMAPSFVWSNVRFSSPEQHRVDYQISSAQSVAEAALQQFEFSRRQCSAQKCADVLVSFTGTEVRSVDLSDESSSGTVEVLKNLIAASNASLAFPYVTASVGSSTTDQLIHTLEENKDFGTESVVFGCPGVKSSPFNLAEIEEHISSKSAAKILLVCLPSPEGTTMTQILTRLDESEIGYVALYSSDPSGNFYASRHRLLASTNGSSSANGSSTTNSTTAPYCDGVCQTKATLLEAIFVAIVLLVILISGLCCMMGIQAPLRFDKPHES